MIGSVAVVTTTPATTTVKPVSTTTMEQFFDFTLDIKFKGHVQPDVITQFIKEVESQDTPIQLSENVEVSVVGVSKVRDASTAVKPNPTPNDSTTLKPATTSTKKMVKPIQYVRVTFNNDLSQYTGRGE